MKRVDYRAFAEWQGNQVNSDLMDPTITQRMLEDRYVYLDYHGKKVYNPYRSFTHGYPVSPERYYGERAFRKWKQRVNNFIRKTHWSPTPA